MKNKIIALVALFGMSFSTFAQTNVMSVVTDNEIKTENEKKSQAKEDVKSQETEADGQVMTMAKSSGKKAWSDRNLAGKILIIGGCAIIVVLAILLPEGYSSR